MKKKMGQCTTVNSKMGDNHRRNMNSGHVQEDMRQKTSKRKITDPHKTH